MVWKSGKGWQQEQGAGWWHCSCTHEAENSSGVRLYHFKACSPWYMPSSKATPTEGSTSFPNSAITLRQNVQIHEPVGSMSNSNQNSLGMNLTRSWKDSIIKPQNTGEYENKTVEMEEGTSPFAHGSAELGENGHIAKVFWCLHKNPNGYSSCQ